MPEETVGPNKHKQVKTDEHPIHYVQEKSCSFVFELDDEGDEEVDDPDKRTEEENVVEDLVMAAVGSSEQVPRTDETDY